MQTIVKKQFVQVDGGAVGSAPQVDRRTPAKRCEKSVRPLEEGGVVRAIEITCSCGETTLVELQYPEK